METISRLVGEPREINPDVDKPLNPKNLEAISSKIAGVPGNATSEKVLLMLDVLKDRGFASPDEILVFNAELAGLGIQEKIDT